jgi:hypothetical protein
MQHRDQLFAHSARGKTIGVRMLQQLCFGRRIAHCKKLLALSTLCGKRARDVLACFLGFEYLLF